MVIVEIVLILNVDKPLSECSHFTDAPLRPDAWSLGPASR